MQWVESLAGGSSRSTPSVPVNSHPVNNNTPI